MDYTFMFYQDYENIKGLLAHFEYALQNDPQDLLRQVDGELDSQYVHDGNNQGGRGIVAESRLHGEIAGLEAVRAEAVRHIQFLAAQKREESALVSMPMINFGTPVRERIDIR